MYSVRCRTLGKNAVLVRTGIIDITVNNLLVACYLLYKLIDFYNVLICFTVRADI